MLKENNLNKLYLFFLTFFSIFFNQYYGYIGILPIDSFLIFNSGFDLMNGYLPFKDYWTIKEPFIDLLQAIFFKVIGVSWFTYVLHASIFNFIITISTYLFFRKLKLNINFCFFYSLCVAILTYPTAGTPFSDHHTLILCLLSLYLFVLGVSFKKNLYWFLLPILLCLAFFSKQAPTSYFILILSLFSLIFFIANKNYKNFFVALLGLFFFLFIFFIILNLNQIDLKDVFYQYILFPMSLGESRLEWLFPLEFKRIIWRFKLYYLSIIILISIYIKEVYGEKIKIFSDDLLIVGTLILSCIAVIVHQLMTINGMFIFCVIPIFAAFSNIYANIYFKKNIINKFLILLVLGSTINYYTKYIKTRSFLDLGSIDINNSIDGSKIHPELKGIKWINIFYPDNPSLEAKLLKLSIKEIYKDKRKKMIVTDYQFISVFNKEYDNSLTRFWWEFHGYPDKENKYFKYWKDFFLNKITKDKIEVIYIVKPFAAGKISFNDILINCSKKKELNKILELIILNDCK